MPFEQHLIITILLKKEKYTNIFRHLSVLMFLEKLHYKYYYK